MSKINKTFTSNQSFNPKNERIKHRYFKYLVGAKQKSVKSADQARKMIMKFEEFTHYSDFSIFNLQIAIGFKEYLLTKGKKETGEIYSQHTVNSALANVRDFYVWLSNEQGFRKSIKPNEFLCLKCKTKRTAVNGSLKLLKHINGKCFVLRGVCDVCGKHLRKTVNNDDAQTHFASLLQTPKSSQESDYYIPQEQTLFSFFN